MLMVKTAIRFSTTIWVNDHLNPYIVENIYHVEVDETVGDRTSSPVHYIDGLKL